ncbi:heme-binding protein [Paenibacillus sp. S28]|uniref:heme-binding protein n=1 Tax=Paenibacillus sp. S28 TaxID=2767463 RepID=UPI003FA38EB9
MQNTPCFLLQNIKRWVVLFPIRVKGVGVVGSVTVGGLTGELDHAYAVEGVRLFLRER